MSEPHDDEGEETPAVDHPRGKVEEVYESANVRKEDLAHRDQGLKDGPLIPGLLNEMITHAKYDGGRRRHCVLLDVGEQFWDVAFASSNEYHPDRGKRQERLKNDQERLKTLNFQSVRMLYSQETYATNAILSFLRIWVG